MAVAPTSSHAQAPPLGTAASFAVLAGSTVTNVPGTALIHTTINGDLGVSPGSACTGFDSVVVVGCSTLPLGFGHVNGAMHAGDAVAGTARVDFWNAYNILAGMSATVDMSGTDLGGKTLVAGVYSFSSTAQLTGTLTLNGQGNPNSVFIFNIGTALNPIAVASNVLLINGAQGGNVFWRVGSSATLGAGSLFAGDILASQSITLVTGAAINCGAAWAHTGQVALDANTITICTTAAASASAALPSSASANQRAVAQAIDTFIANGGTLPPAFQNLLIFLSPSQLAAAFTQLSGEAGTGTAQAATQAMNSFLSLVINPFGDNRPFADNRVPPPEAPVYKAPVYKAPAYTLLGLAPDPRRWGIWAAGYGNQSNAAGDEVVVGSHDRSVTTFGYATGVDYRVTPYTLAGFALGGGGTRYGLADGLGGGRSDMFQAAVYSSTRVSAAYVSAALAYAWHHVSTDRYVTVAGTGHLTSDFSANNIGGRIEGGYRFALPSVLGWPVQYGFTPYAAGQAQSFRAPSYSERAASGSAIFALAYDARTTTTTRTELGAWFDWAIPTGYGSTLVLRSRAAWAHDHWSAPTITAMFEALPGSSFTVTGAAPASDLLLASAGAELGLGNGFSVAAWFDGELAEHSQKYAGNGRLRYTW
jgi:uncharacterized protein with beta-barrel porin domain